MELREWLLPSPTPPQEAWACVPVCWAREYRALLPASGCPCEGSGVFRNGGLGSGVDPGHSACHSGDWPLERLVCLQGVLTWRLPSSWGRSSSARDSSSLWLGSSTSSAPVSSPGSSTGEAKVLPAPTQVPGRLPPTLHQHVGAFWGCIASRPESKTGLCCLGSWASSQDRCLGISSVGAGPSSHSSCPPSISAFQATPGAEQTWVWLSRVVQGTPVEAPMPLWITWG